MPILKKTSARRLRRGDFLAVLLLFAVLAGVGWLWWQHKHPAKKSQLKAVVVTKIAAPPVIKAEPKKELRPIVVAPATPADFPRPVRDVFEAQVALARRAVSIG